MKKVKSTPKQTISDFFGKLVNQLKESKLKTIHSHYISEGYDTVITITKK
jgi:hypothetical protein